ALLAAATRIRLDRAGVLHNNGLHEWNNAEVRFPTPRFGRNNRDGCGPAKQTPPKVDAFPRGGQSTAKRPIFAMLSLEALYRTCGRRCTAGYDGWWLATREDWDLFVASTTHGERSP